MDDPAGTWAGAEIVGRAFRPEHLAGLGPAVEALTGNRDVVRTLAGALRPWEWTESRAAAGALHALAPPALPAIPALAAWLVMSAGASDAPAQQLAVHETALTLRDLRIALRGAARGAPDDATTRLIRFQLEVVDPHVLALTALPPRLWHRGVAAYLREAPPDPATAAEALGSLLSRDYVPPRGYEDWWAYARAEILTVLGELAAPAGSADPAPPPPPPEAPVDPLEALWDAPAYTDAPDERDPPGTAGTGA